MEGGRLIGGRLIEVGLYLYIIIECFNIPASYSYLFLWVGQRSFPRTGFFAALTSAHHRAVIPSNVVILRGAAGRCAAPIVNRFRIAFGFRNQFGLLMG